MDERGTTDVARGTIEHAKWQYNRAPDVSLLGVLALGVVAAIVIGGFATEARSVRGRDAAASGRSTEDAMPLGP